MSWDDGLHEPHLSIAGSTASRIGVLAGPGTGKTSYGLMRRVARLLTEGVDGRRILLLSFTRTAAHDLTTKVADLQVPGAESVKASTLHGYCFGLLQRDAVLAVTNRNPRILLPHEADLMLRDLGGDIGDIKERRSKLEAFQAGWLRTADDHPFNSALPEERVFERSAIWWLRHHKAMLIGEVVPLAFAYLKNNPAAEDLTSFDHIIVDEYQDLNALEQRLLDLLSEHSAMCVAGDDDQSIYRFRYANPSGILDYQRRDEVEPYEIDLCGRCPRIVLSMANSLIGHASGRAKPPLGCLNSEADGDVSIIQWDDLDAEIDGLVAAIVEDVRLEKVEAGDVLVLAHRKHIGERIRRGLVDNGIPARSFFKEEGLSTSAAQEALALLRLKLGDDPVALRVVLGLDDQEGRTAAYQRLMKFAAENNASEHTVLDRLLAGETLPLQVSALVGRYKHALKRIELLQLENLDELVDALVPEENEDLADLRELFLDVRPDSEDARELLQNVVNALTQMDIPQDPAFVRIMSLHKSKGLTSPTVYVAGLMEGIVPTLPERLSESGRDAAVEEQRRLLYVAITRSSNQLTLSNSISIELALAYSLGARVDKATIRKRGEAHWAKAIASPYLLELGPDAPTPIRGLDWLRDR